jgi:diaminopimelate decarboxylase
MSFDYQGGQLTCDGVRLADIADAAGTPVYVYSASAIVAAYSALDGAFAGYPHRLHYALKANSTLAIARLLRRLGSGVDANSVGEIEVALRAGFAPADIVFSGVGKRADELERAVDVGVQAVNVESAGEVERLDAAARRRGARARVSVRVNPDVDAHTHPHITTGVKTAKFGVPADAVRELCVRVAASDALRLVGLHVHIGSQILAPEPFGLAAASLAALAAGLQNEGIELEHVDLGGGLGIDYEGRCSLPAADYARAVLHALAPSRTPLLLEPGRVIVGPAGVLLTRIVDIKQRPGGTAFAIADAGMTELIRPALYGAFHRIEPVAVRDAEAREYEVVGPLCETSDTYGQLRSLPRLEVGDVLAVRDAGAYGSVMASTYNRRPLAPEVLVENGAWRVIRRRQTIDDMLVLEI